MENETIEATIFKDLNIDGLSNTSKIYLIGRYVEIILRFALRIKDKDSFTLQNGSILFKKFKYYKDSYEKIKKMRNKCVHSQFRYVATDEDFLKASKCLDDMQSFLFFCFFKKNGFGCNLDAVSCFSLLPPKIRAITLVNLLDFKTEFVENDCLLVEKAILALLKNDEPVAANEVLIKYANDLKKFNQFGCVFEKSQIFLKSRKRNPANLYVDLPEAGSAYRTHRQYFLNKNDSQLNELLEIMDFIYSVL